MNITNIMKRCLVIGLMMLMLLAAGCGGSNETDDTTEKDTVSSEQTSDNSQTAADQSTGVEDIDISVLGGDGVDVDISKLSSTMVYSVVNDMMMRPNEYLGKTVRMKGSMSIYHDEDTDVTYYACIIKDATACCAQGIEFQTTDAFDPSDYPADGEDVTVSGRFDLYEEDGYQYCVLKDAVLE